MSSRRFCASWDVLTPSPFLSSIEADHPGVKLIGRWHDLVAVGGVLICESDDISAVQSWALNWSGVLNIEVRPVVDDNEAKTMLKKKWNL